MVKIKNIIFAIVLVSALVFSFKGVHAYVEYEDVFYGRFLYQMQMTDTYSLLLEVPSSRADEQDVILEDGRYYYDGNVGDLITNASYWYDGKQANYTLSFDGIFTPQAGDEWTLFVNTNTINVPLGSQIIISSGFMRIIHNGAINRQIALATNPTNIQYGFGYFKYFGYSPDYYDGYDTGYLEGKEDGLYEGRNDGLIQGRREGMELYGYEYQGIWWTASDWGNYRYNLAYEEFGDGSYWGTLWSAVLAPFSLLAFELLPGITIGMIVAVPIVFGLLAWILSAGKSKK